MSAKKRSLIAEKTKWKCGYCGCGLIKNTLRIDHIIAKQNGGDNSMDNLVAACQTCNSSKGTKTLEEYRLFVSFKKAVPFPHFSQVQIEFLLKEKVLENLGVNSVNIFPFEELSNEW